MASDTKQISVSREELHAFAKSFLFEMYGKPNETVDRDLWYQHLGFLIHFVNELVDKK